MNVKEIEKLKIECLRCGHIWIRRKEEVRVCPKCHSPYFDKPKKEKR